MAQTKAQLLAGKSDQSVTFNDATVSSLNGGPLSGTRNRIINGDMRIDQRNAGASVTPATGTPAYAVDRFSCSVSQNSKCTLQQNAGSVTPPAGFSHYLGFTSTSAYSIGVSDYFGIQQRIEGFNFSDFGFGTASAKQLTISFWVRSSLNQTFAINLQNGAQTRSYGATYSISAANTWEQKIITISGDTSGTWTADNSAGLILTFGLGIGSTYSIAGGSWQTTTSPNGFGTTGATSVVGTNGATFYITGVQLEAGTVATPFERRSYGQELALCQRYYFKMLNDTGTTIYPFVLQAYNTTSAFGKLIDLPVPMRATPTCVASGTFVPNSPSGGSTTAFSSMTIDRPSKYNLTAGGWGGSSSLTVGQATVIQMSNNAYLDASAEL